MYKNRKSQTWLCIILKLFLNFSDSISIMSIDFNATACQVITEYAVKLVRFPDVNFRTLLTMVCKLMIYHATRLVSIYTLPYKNA